MFAGPNGSGKSTIKTVVSPALLGVYINPDEIEEEIRRSGSLSLEAYRVAATEEEISAFVAGSPLAQKAFPETTTQVPSPSSGLRGQLRRKQQVSVRIFHRIGITQFAQDSGFGGRSHGK